MIQSTTSSKMDFLLPTAKEWGGCVVFSSSREGPFSCCKAGCRRHHHHTGWLQGVLTFDVISHQGVSSYLKTITIPESHVFTLITLKKWYEGLPLLTNACSHEILSWVVQNRMYRTREGFRWPGRGGAT